MKPYIADFMKAAISVVNTIYSIYHTTMSTIWVNKVWFLLHRFPEYLDKKLRIKQFENDCLLLPQNIMFLGAGMYYMLCKLKSSS